ncbi:MAG: ABC transporter substrate-binding protein [Candidatus Hodarchaeales archaeon]|jgi:ABC-type Fe3+ transport system substrate-binding protein
MIRINQKASIIFVLFGFMLSVVGGNLTLLSTTNVTASESAPNATQIKVLTRHSSTIFNEMEDAFKASSYAPSGDIDIVFKTFGPSQWPATIAQGDIDLGWGGGPTLFDEQISRGYIRPITEAAILTEIGDMNATYWQGPPAGTIAGSPMYRYSGNDLMWVGSAIASFGFTVNEFELENRGLLAPSKWEHLAHPTYYRDTPAIAIGNAPDTTSNTRIFEIILQHYGWDLGWAVLTMMGGNSVIKTGSTEVLVAVEEGDVAIGTTIDFYGYEAELEYEGNRYILPEGQSIVNADPIAFTTNTHGDSGRDELAAAFMHYVLSDEGQAVLLADQIKRMPIRSDAFAEAAKDPSKQYVSQLQTLYNRTLGNIGIDFNDTLSLSYENTMREYQSATTYEAHTELRQAAKAIAQAWRDSRMSDAQLYLIAMDLGDPIITEAEAQSINEDIGDDQTFKESKKSEWRQAAKEKYIEVKNAATALAYNETPPGYEQIPANNPFKLGGDGGEPTATVSKKEAAFGFRMLPALFCLSILGLVLFMKRRRWA